MGRITKPQHHHDSSHKLDWESCAPLLADKVDRSVLLSLAEFKGSYPQEIAADAGISPKEVIGRIQKLETCGFIEKNEEEIKEFGEKWAFYALSPVGYQVINNLKHLGKLE